MESIEKPDLMRDLQRTCRKLEAAILECERLLEASPLALPTAGLLAAAVGAGQADAEAGPPQEVQR